MKIVTFNLRCMWDHDGQNSFPHRAILISEKILAEKPDIVAFQEVTEKQLPVMERIMPEYLFVGHGRSETYGGEGLYTAIRKDAFALLGLDITWMSPTPHTPATRYENQSWIPRICVMTKLQNRDTKEVIRVFNVHLDHLSDEARVTQAEGLLELVGSYHEDYPVVILGDFNALPDSEAIRVMNRCEILSELTGNIPTTFHDYGKKTEPDKIDYMYVSHSLADRAGEAVDWKEEENGIYLSDHYPISVEFTE